jgi:HSP20 family protein
MARSLIRKSRGGDVAPWRELDLFSDHVRRLMEPALGGSFFDAPLWGETDQWIPAVELDEQDGEYLLSAELPGIEEGDVDISVDDSTLTLKGEKKSEKEETKGRTHYRERRYGAFERSFTLPRNTDPSKIKAEFENGVVKVHIPKSAETKARRIEVKSSSGKAGK